MEVRHGASQVWPEIEEDFNHEGCAYCETLVTDLKGFYVEESKNMED